MSATAVTTGRRVTPTGRLVATLDPVTDRAAWLAERRQGIGGSDVPALLGLDDYRSELDLWRDKTGQADDDEQVEAAVWGTLLEDPVAREWARRSRVRVQRVGTIAHERRPWQRVNLDRRVVGCTEHHRCALEVKTRSAFKASQWTDRLPDDVEAQTQWAIAVTGLDAMHVAGLIGGQRLVHHVVRPDPALIEQLTLIGERFWYDHVQAGLPPDISSIDLLVAYLSGLDVAPGSVANLEGDEARQVEALLARRAELKAGERELKDIDQALKAYAGEHAVVEVDGVRAYTYRSIVSRRFATGDFAAADPDTYEAYRRPSTARRLDVAKQYR